MAGNSKRDIIQLESTAGTGYRYTVTKSKRTHPSALNIASLIQLSVSMSSLKRQNKS